MFQAFLIILSRLAYNSHSAFSASNLSDPWFIIFSSSSTLAASIVVACCLSLSVSTCVVCLSNIEIEIEQSIDANDCHLWSNSSITHHLTFDFYKCESSQANCLRLIVQLAMILVLDGSASTSITYAGLVNNKPCKSSESILKLHFLPVLRCIHPTYILAFITKVGKSKNLIAIPGLLTLTMSLHSPISWAKNWKLK